MILVVGSTGMLGYEICRLLTSEGRPVRALVRNAFKQERARQLREIGAQIIQGDLCHVKTLGPALKGVTHIISTASSMPFSYVPEENDIRLVDKNGMMDLINLAAASGVRQFIYTSLSGNIDGDFPLRNAKRTVELHLRNSGMTFTILRPSFFMEYWLSPASGFDPEKGKVQIYGTGNKPVSYISYPDVAKFAVNSLSNPLASNVILELGGPDKLTQLEAVSLFEEIAGRKFDYQNYPEEHLRAQRKRLMDPMQNSVAGLMLSMAEGDPVDMNDTLKGFRIRLRTVRDYASSKVTTP